ncbi:NB-ARC domain-containing protein [Streptomyces sp. MCA2]|uniref:AfsR/SARP family transcriptional regulator n=1 Tax=Streptomyces sp. MCA2 TaxID=2944805 RepID=UPI002020EA13|nr:BTAD domain-containing putative transcriptional regulator [Streptomyces sp. MCA2]MCL7496359.1 NB-ARC domain-containing protein [Streptomyces sp. MCA2]
MTKENQRIAIGGARQRTILALLLLNPGRIVSVDTLVETVWNGRPPATARTQVAICIAALRKRFKAEGCDNEVIVTAHPGYLLALENHYVDSVEFERLTLRAQEAAKEQRTSDAAALHEEALALWRGPALAGVAGTLVEDEMERLEELRLAGYDGYVAAQLELGHHGDLIPGLVSVVRDHPLRERSRYALMLAQYRVGRRAEAMETFREGRAQFIEGLGLEPGPALRELHDAILRDDPSLMASAVVVPKKAPETPRTAPLELPADIPAFVGRDTPLASLNTLVDGHTEGRRLTMGLITGGAGVGKTGLAVHWAHQVADEFPGGLLFADMWGYDETHDPADPAVVLGWFLRSLGVPEAEIPAETHERAALYRSVLADRRVLIVLDNVRSFDQVRALIPGSSRSCVLLTSRSLLEQLVVRHGAVSIHLDVLRRREATDLLAQFIGEERVDAARADAERLVELCDRLPLTVRIAAARLAAKPQWPIGYLASRLDNEQLRLDELSSGESQVRSSFALSYHALPHDVALLYRRLGLLDAPDFAGWVGAALLATDTHKAEGLMESLVDAHLLQTVGFDSTGQPRYGFRNLLRLHARELAKEEGSALEQREALHRAFRGWLSVAEQARRREFGSGHGEQMLFGASMPTGPMGTAELDTLTASPSGWFEAERLALISVIDQAARCGMDDLSRELTELVVRPAVACQHS